MRGMSLNERPNKAVERTETARGTVPPLTANALVGESGTVQICVNTSTFCWIYRSDFALLYPMGAIHSNQKGVLVRKNSDLVVSFLTLRQMIGAIGLLMPFLVRLGGHVFEHISTTDSISAYYYTGMRDVFVSTLVLVGILMACYRTPRMFDNVLSTITGLAAIGIGLFPMSPVFAQEILRRFPDMDDKRCYVNRGILGYHFIFVAAFFPLCCFRVTFRFTALTPPNPSREMRWRNFVYRVCGVVMLLSFIAIGVLFFRGKGESIFWPETAAVVAFGVAWLVKGQTILKDKPGSRPRFASSESDMIRGRGTDSRQSAA